MKSWFGLLAWVFAFFLILFIVFPSVNILFLLLVSLLIASMFHKQTRRGIKKIVFDVSGVLISGEYFTQPLGEMPGMKDTIKELRRKGYSTAVFSNNNAIAYKCISKHFDYEKLFDEHVVSSELGKKKPDPESFERMLSRIKAKPEEIVFVDDTLENVEAAMKMGIKAIQFKDANQLRHDLKKLGVELD